MKTAKTHSVQIFIAGPLATIEAVCAEFCAFGCCVSVSPCTFVFTGGQETGARIELINYARFPKEPAEHLENAKELATLLFQRTHQRSLTIQTPDESMYLENPALNIPR
jgi:hypothetical protein